jgi:hypothetical protein
MWKKLVVKFTAVNQTSWANTLILTAGVGARRAALYTSAQRRALFCSEGPILRVLNLHFPCNLADELLGMAHILVG